MSRWQKLKCFLGLHEWHYTGTTDLMGRQRATRVCVHKPCGHVHLFGGRGWVSIYPDR